MIDKETSGSNVLSACIAAGIVIAAIIIAKPKLPFIFAPISRSSVERQFVDQVQSQFANKTVSFWTGDESIKTAIKRVEVEKVEYNEKHNTYVIRYWIYYTSPYSYGTSCLLDSRDSRTFSGGCTVGTEQTKNEVIGYDSARIQVT